MTVHPVLTLYKIFCIRDGSSLNDRSILSTKTIKWSKEELVDSDSSEDNSRVLIGLKGNRDIIFG